MSPDQQATAEPARPGPGRQPPPAVVAGQAAAAAAEVEAALAVTPDLTAAAFFDIDNTVVRGASIFYLGLGLAQRKFFTLGDVVGFARDQVKFRLGGEDMGDMASATETALGFVKGHEVSEVVQLGREIFDERIVGKVYPGTLAMARSHLDAGQRVWLVSAAPVELATIIAKRLGLTGALGTVSEIRGGVYTGRLVGRPLHGPAKAEAVRALAEREGLDLSRCAAYSDSSNDIPMLSLVGDPCAVNPDSKLRNHAKDLGWRIVDYRTGRKAFKVGAPAVAGTALVAGIAVGAIAVDRRRRHPG